ncbi:MAG: hypothetical protein FJ126_01170 [Deltaproteobacteria bacterium]|nr:hypothetical protein [Deltaproteobacteria bacterium]
MVRKPVFAFLMILAVVLSNTISLAGQPKLAQAVYLTMTQACGCILDRCKAGDWVVEKVFEGPKQGLLLRIDYSTEKPKALEYIKKYRIAMAPAIIFLDAQGSELWRAMGELDLNQVQGKLREFGG